MYFIFKGKCAQVLHQTIYLNEIPIKKREKTEASIFNSNQRTKKPLIKWQEKGKGEELRQQH